MTLYEESIWLVLHETKFRDIFPNLFSVIERRINSNNNDDIADLFYVVGLSLIRNSVIIVWTYSLRSLLLTQAVPSPNQLFILQTSIFGIITKMWQQLWR